MQKSKPQHEVFTVDTHLFRELGRLLVGRESTALSELIKNAYDADASYVRVYGHNIADAGKGFIRVTDDGIGISHQEFMDGFLRIASRMRQTPTRRSLLYNRRFTGAKGIGRLAAHKLAALLEITSTPNRRKSRNLAGIEASIDWDVIEGYDLLEQARDAVTVREINKTADSNAGTVLTLSRIRRGWTPARRAAFAFDALALQPPTIFVEPLPAELVRAPLVFSKPSVRDVKALDPGFRVEVSGDFDIGEDYWSVIGLESTWVIEVRASRQNGLEAAIAPSRKTRSTYPDARLGKFNRELYSDAGPFFEARLFVREGRIGNEIQRSFARRNAGVRVYMEGFRVLPYGDPKDDWLDIQMAYGLRAPSLFDLTPGEGGKDRPELVAPPSSAYYGAVFLTEAKSPGLEMLVNREGFVEGPALDALTNSLKWAIQLFIRSKAAATFKARERRRLERSKQSAQGTQQASRPSVRSATFASDEPVAELSEDALQAVQRAQARIAQNGVGVAPQSLSILEKELSDLLSQYRAAFGEDLWLLRLLAAVGTQMATFVHEMRGLLGIVSTMEVGLRRLNTTVDGASLRIVRDLQRALADVRGNLDRQVSYLVDVVSVDARRRRSRQSPHDAFEKALKLLSPQAKARGIVIQNKVPREIRTIPMFAAELRTIMSNLLSNAVRAAGRHGKIRATAAAKDDSITFVLQNTGRRVSLRNAEKWFRPFESSSMNIEPDLGQGMGLGLPITRATLQPYNAEIEFVPPTQGFSTAVRIRIPGS